jgi:hypothetical protein
VLVKNVLLSRVPLNRVLVVRLSKVRRKSADRFEKQPTRPVICLRDSSINVNCWTSTDEMAIMGPSARCSSNPPELLAVQLGEWTPSSFSEK